MDRKSITDIIEDWRSIYIGRIPKGARNETLNAMTELIELMVKEGHEYDQIKTVQTSNQVVRACVHQGPITPQLTKQKRDAWTAKTTDLWNMAHRRWRMANEGINLPTLSTEENLEKPRPYSPPAKIEPIKPEERLDYGMFDGLKPEEPAVNTELTDFFKKHSNE